MKKKNRRNDCFPLQDDSRKPNEEMIKGEKIGIKKRLKKISDLFVQCTHIIHILYIIIFISVLSKQSERFNCAAYESAGVKMHLSTQFPLEIDFASKTNFM